MDEINSAGYRAPLLKHLQRVWSPEIHGTFNAVDAKCVQRLIRMNANAVDVAVEWKKWSSCSDVVADAEVDRRLSEVTSRVWNLAGSIRYICTATEARENIKDYEGRTVSSDIVDKLMDTLLEESLRSPGVVHRREMLSILSLSGKFSADIYLGPCKLDEDGPVHEGAVMLGHYKVALTGNHCDMLAEAYDANNPGAHVFGEVHSTTKFSPAIRSRMNTADEVRAFMGEIAGGGYDVIDYVDSRGVCVITARPKLEGYKKILDVSGTRKLEVLQEDWLLLKQLGLKRSESIAF